MAEQVVMEALPVKLLAAAAVRLAIVAMVVQVVLRQVVDSPVVREVAAALVVARVAVVAPEVLQLAAAAAAVLNFMEQGQMAVVERPLVVAVVVVQAALMVAPVVTVFTAARVVALLQLLRVVGEGRAVLPALSALVVVVAVDSLVAMLVAAQCGLSGPDQLVHSHQTQRKTGFVSWSYLFKFATVSRLNIQSWEKTLKVLFHT
jgi:hypothetical protein